MMLKGYLEIKKIKWPKSKLKQSIYLKNHQLKGAKLVEYFLIEQGAPKYFINKVKGLVENHEIGGGKNRNIIKDADSISFFENNVTHLLNDLIKDLGRESIHDKFKWMYQRISSKKAKDIVKTWYINSIKNLDNYEKNR